MAYNNLFNRFFLSLFFFFIYFISYNNKLLLFTLGTLIYLLVLFEVFKFFKKLFKLILSYLLLSYFCFSLYFFVFFDTMIFNIFIFSIILFDSLSYFAGKSLGKIYIFKFISPKKTLEGYVGGVLLTNIFLISYFFIFSIEIKIITLILIINLTIFVSIIGDLIESHFKRKNNLKDSSNYLPGHGGYFDRFDSFLASIIFLTLFSLL